MDVIFWFAKMLIDGFWFWDWQWRKFNGGDLIAEIRWGYLWNKCLNKGIDRICYWLESLLSNHVTCTYGIFCLDMILIEITQRENPRHVIDAMSSMKLNLIRWWFGVILLCFVLCLWCRMEWQWMVLGNSCKKLKDS